MNLIRTSTTEEFVRTAVQWIAGTLHASAKDGGKPVIGLSGGSTPIPVYTMLATQQSVPWERVTLFLLDERYVPAGHQDSNARMITSTIATRSGAAATLLSPDTTLPLAECIADYDRTISALPRSDLVILGMGLDGHIASLFPPAPPEAFGPKNVLHTQTDQFAVRDRISVTFPLLEHAKQRVFLITGSEKFALMQKIKNEMQDASLLPASALIDDRTTWIVGP